MAFLQALDLFVVPAVYDDPKGIALLEAMACGCPWWRRVAALTPRCLNAPVAGCSWSPTIWSVSSRHWSSSPAIAPGWAELGQRAADGVREHYSTGEMTTRALDVYVRLTR